MAERLDVAATEHQLMHAEVAQYAKIEIAAVFAIGNQYSTLDLGQQPNQLLMRRIESSAIQLNLNRSI